MDLFNIFSYKQFAYFSKHFAYFTCQQPIELTAHRVNSSPRDNIVIVISPLQTGEKVA